MLIPFLKIFHIYVLPTGQSRLLQALDHDPIMPQRVLSKLHLLQLISHPNNHIIALLIAHGRPNTLTNICNIHGETVINAPINLPHNLLAQYPQSVIEHISIRAIHDCAKLPFIACNLDTHVDIPRFSVNGNPIFKWTLASLLRSCAMIPNNSTTYYTHNSSLVLMSQKRT